MHDHENIGLNIEPIWLETTLEARVIAPSARPDPSKRRLRIGLGLLTLAVLFAWVATDWAQPSASDWAVRGWAAYNDGSYRTANVALAEARRADPDTATLGTLERAIAVGAMLDEIETLIETGELSRAQRLMPHAVARAPRDWRTVVTQGLLTQALSTQALLQAAQSDALDFQSALAASPVAVPAVVDPSVAVPAVVDPSVAAAAVVDPSVAVAAVVDPSVAAAAGVDPSVAAPTSVASSKVARTRVARRVTRRRRRSSKTTLPVAQAVSRLRERMAKGSVRISSDQPALVLVDGVLMRNEAPTTLRLAVGDHVVELRVPGTGQILARHTVRVKAGRAEVVGTQAAPESSAATAQPRAMRVEFPRGGAQ